MDRRNVLKVLLSGLVLSITPTLPVPVLAQSAPDFGLPTLPQERVHRIKMGGVEIIALHDGATRLPLSDRYVVNAPFAEVKKLASVQGLSTEYVELPFTAYLIVSGSRHILLDTGLGEFGSPRETTGKLTESLRLAGYEPEDIDTILISHFHADHISGLRNAAGNFVYPNATVWVPEPEYDYWMSDANRLAAPLQRKGAFEIARRVFLGMPEKMLRKFSPGIEVAPGIFSKAAYGHTPGHTIYEVRSGKSSFYYIADMINVPAFFATHPEWMVASDIDPERALEVRRQFLSMVEKTNPLVGGFHFPFPGVGHLEPEGAGYKFYPENQSN
ncbi:MULTISPECIES: MBL fold metallo-hydrolase [Pseudomonas]|uniref:Zn-dependent hydrolase, glyoxylase n=1 Tax=Pseudomonas asplenii TaxID=53407 RepID=A0A0M9GCD2_9PSED|nr:MBL fold metallo-hydrolase [Pseudomonas fuscovaginae]KPA87597.1 Zn-dependent hydrolase, glyoxylase [Pseudomonas fuscovaginae]KPA94177.1 Zn-dependent hydrolase, glyoxylase [Pseudomonas fuscovaginae]